MLKYLSCFFIGFLLLQVAVVQGQFIHHGPVVGGVTDGAARMYIRTDSVETFEIELDPNPNFPAPLVFTTTTRLDRDYSVITDLVGLQPDTKYYYRFRFAGVLDTLDGSFSTFPLEGTDAHLLIVTGSCQETPNMKTYNVMQSMQPDLLIHTGDYTYPSYEIGANYPVFWSTIPTSYRTRYSEPEMTEFLRYTPIDYVPDDDDNWGSGKDANVSMGYSIDPVTQVITNYFNFRPITAQMRLNCLRGYRWFFPGYGQVDSTAAHYHSFKMANAEFFFLDTRSCADSLSKGYRLDPVTQLWVYDPPADFTTLGQAQIDWLLNGLSNSTAHWKFIVSGVPFNPSLARFIHTGLIYQQVAIPPIGGVGGTGLALSVAFAVYFAGHPHDYNQILDHITQNNIERVLVISGDTHHNVMDDGTNSILPELNASGLSVATTELAYQLNLFGPFLGLPPMTDSTWNGGGNGLFNNNNKNGFGKVEIFGADSVQYCVIDEDSTVLSCFVIRSDGSVNNTVGTRQPGTPTFSPFIARLFPNPAKDLVTMELYRPFTTLYEAQLFDPSGKKVKTLQLQQQDALHYEFSVADLPPGQFYLWMRTDAGMGALPLLKE